MITSLNAFAGMSGWSITAVDAVVKATLLLAFVAAAARALRAGSASLRHFLWTLGIVGSLVLPILSRATPVRVVVLRTAPTPVAATTQQFQPNASVAQSAAVGAG